MWRVHIRWSSTGIAKLPYVRLADWPQDVRLPDANQGVWVWVCGDVWVAGCAPLLLLAACSTGQAL